MGRSKQRQMLASAMTTGGSVTGVTNRSSSSLGADGDDADDDPDFRASLSEVEISSVLVSWSEQKKSESKHQDAFAAFTQTSSSSSPGFDSLRSQILMEDDQQVSRQ